ncbi:hypothetical protein PR202_ga12711 [Eleusine coracana subsp. coracana]|uniref:Uncharacterized protein n=1 Tax=Eleusine coracana subsp. coracana TaxID=191504 RepID=A0AAV5CCF1_ELECO|nr:hypothetical protein PR202_ga12711 [Eleusine coracana subsp. coracana]
MTSASASRERNDVALSPATAAREEAALNLHRTNAVASEELGGAGVGPTALAAAREQLVEANEEARGKEAVVQGLVFLGAICMSSAGLRPSPNTFKARPEIIQRVALRWVPHTPPHACPMLRLLAAGAATTRSPAAALRRLLHIGRAGGEAESVAYRMSMLRPPSVVPKREVTRNSCSLIGRLAAPVREYNGSSDRHPKAYTFLSVVPSSSAPSSSSSGFTLSPPPYLLFVPNSAHFPSSLLAGLLQFDVWR